MSLSELELLGIELPPKETCISDLTAQQIVDKIGAFHERLKRENHLEVARFAESYFLDLIALYPVSMCRHTMTDELKLVAALFYFGSKPVNEKAKLSQDQDLKELFPNIAPSQSHFGYSIEDLALVFDRNKATIAEAIRQKQKEAKIMLEKALLCYEYKKDSMARLDEKTKP
jgi:hypothetical protein